MAGRPYHADPEINHGIGKLLTSLELAVLSEDSVFEEAPIVKVNVLNQWTYHARLYRSAEYVAHNEDMNQMCIRDRLWEARAGCVSSP